MMFTDSVGDIHFFDYAMEPFEKRWVIAGVFPVSQGSGVKFGSEFLYALSSIMSGSADTSF